MLDVGGKGMSDCSLRREQLDLGRDYVIVSN
jgi:hypothetical protein